VADILLQVESCVVAGGSVVFQHVEAFPRQLLLTLNMGTSFHACLKFFLHLHKLAQYFVILDICYENDVSCFSL